MQDIIAGIDFCRDYTQLSIFNRTTRTPDSVALVKAKSALRAPTAVTLMKDNNEWIMFSETHKEDPDNFQTYENLYELIEQKATISAGGKEHHIDMVLMKYFRRIIWSASPGWRGNDIKGLTIAIKEHNEAVEEVLALTMENLGIEKSKYRIMTHIECFMYFVVMQNRDIWLNDVGIFDFDEEGFKSYILKFGRKQTPLTVAAESSDFSDTIRFNMLEDDSKDRLLFAFENVCGLFLHKQSISAVYATGNGFDSNWADEILKRMCNGRRIFRGQNLYVKGAAYASLLTFESGGDNYQIIGEDELKSTLSLRAVTNAKITEVPFGEIGQKYYKAGGSVEIIMDGTDEIDFIVHNALKKDFFCAIVTLDSLEMRKDKTSRLKVDVSFKNRDSAVITVRDVGFGDIRPTDYRIWEQVISL